MNKWLKVLLAQILLSLFLLIGGYPILGEVGTSIVWFLATVWMTRKFFGGVRKILSNLFDGAMTTQPSGAMTTQSSGIGLAAVFVAYPAANLAVYAGIKIILYLFFGFDFPN
jgi:uncharacterized protein involved in cysteine biosynthesis